MARVGITCRNNAPPRPVPYHDSLRHRIESWISTRSTINRRVAADRSPEMLWNNGKSPNVQFGQRTLPLKLDLEGLAWLAKTTVETHGADNVRHIRVEGG